MEITLSKPSLKRVTISAEDVVHQFSEPSDIPSPDEGTKAIFRLDESDEEVIYSVS